MAAVERQEREQVDDRQDERDEAEDHQAVAGAVGDRFVGDLADADDRMDFVARLRARERPPDARQQVARRRSTSRAPPTPAAASTPNCLGAAPKSKPISILPASRAVAGVDRQRQRRVPRAGPSAAQAWRARQPSVSAPGQRWAAIARCAEVTVAGCPSTASIRSPGLSTPSAGLPRSIACTERRRDERLDRGVEVPERQIAVEAARSRGSPRRSRTRSASSCRARRGSPTIRFHGGWLQ